MEPANHSKATIGLAFITIVFALLGEQAFAVYCPAGSSECDEYISDVHVGVIHNTSTSCSIGGYSDYTAMTTEMEIGESYQITVSNGYAFADDQCGIWIDWNQDEDFNDTSETISIGGVAWNYQAIITVPESATPGQTRMRTRITYTGPVSSCGTASYGEVEDYSVEVIPAGTYEVIHESATMGSFGQSLGLSFESGIFMGSRFHVDERVEVSTIGGHLKEYSSGTVFGAIIPLAGPTALPTGDPFNPWEVGISVVFTLPDASMDFRVPLSATLPAGDYALIFGSGLFGASVTGAGLILGPEQSNLPGASYILWGDEGGWFDINPTDSPRFVVEGISGTVITIGTGTSTSAYPMQTDWPDSRTQVIYLASEIGMGGSITALGLDVDTVPGIVINNWTIRMKHTELNSYGSNPGDYAPLDGVGWKVVYESFEMPGSPGWRTFNLQYPFEYNGTDNLLIDFCVDNVIPGDSGWCRYSKPGGTRQVHARANNDYGDPHDWSGITSPSAFGSDNVPNLKLTIFEIECGPEGYGGGCGTVPDPYLIYTAEQMNNIGANPDDWDKHFKLMNDIDLSGYTGTSFNLIGAFDNLFSGTFDGNHKKIFNFSYNTSSTSRAGLFRMISPTATIRRLGLIDSNVSSAGSPVGALIGASPAGDPFSKSAVIDCYVEGGSVSSPFSVGGLVGQNSDGLIQNCYSTCSVGGNGDWAGGLVGHNRGVIANCYSTGDVIGDHGIGGLVGYNESEGEIINCYSTGRVTGLIVPSINVGGLVGEGTGTVTDSFWDTDTSRQNSSAGGTGKTTEEMQTQSTFTNWDFITPVWMICEDVEYPKLWRKDAKYGGGSGTVDDPYLIFTPCQMQEIGTKPNDWDRHFKLMADIDVGRYSGDEFNIIGNFSSRFAGIFDGNSHEISNFNYSITGVGGPGFIAIFGVVDGASAEIRNLGVVDPNIEANIWFYVAPLVGQLKDGRVSNCYAIGGNVSGMWDTGGLVGANQGTISECMSSVSVGGDDFTGGLVGGNYGAVNNCYAIGSVWGDDTLGGLVGLEDDDGTVNNCYALGSVSGISNSGGLVGLQIGGVVTVANSFWDVNTSGLDTSDGGIPKTTAEMQMASTFTTAGWDFDNIWKICEAVNYPKHRREKYTGGIGTPEAPCLICSAEEMQAIGANPDDWDKHFKLMADIDLAAYTGTQFNIIGGYPDGRLRPFTGVFDGDNHVISNFNYNSSGTELIGLFGFIGFPQAQAEIRNVGLINPVVHGDTGEYIGALVGEVFKGTVTNCYAESGILSGNSAVGGLIGSVWTGEVRSCRSNCQVTGNNYIGGLMGVNNFGTVADSFSNGNVSGTTAAIGGLCGLSSSGSLFINCYSTASVWGDETGVGGLTGIASDPHLENCYAAGSVANVSGEYAGGLVGGYLGTVTVTNSFWDIQATGQERSAGGENGGTGLTTEQMQDPDTFLEAGWDFVGETVNGPNDIWTIWEGAYYPRLAWENPLSGDFALDNLWMYQNLPGQTNSNLIADVLITDDPLSNSSYTYDWEIILPDDVTMSPTITAGGGPADPCCTFAAPACNESGGISDSGQPLTVKVTVTGADFGNTGIAEAQFGIALLGDVNNDAVVNVADRSIINAFWRLGAAGPFTFTDCNINCDTAVNVADRSIANAVWRGVLGQNSVSNPCPLR